MLCHFCFIFFFFCSHCYRHLYSTVVQLVFRVFVHSVECFCHSSTRFFSVLIPKKGTKTTIITTNKLASLNLKRWYLIEVIAIYIDVYKWVHNTGLSKNQDQCYDIRLYQNAYIWPMLRRWILWCVYRSWSIQYASKSFENLQFGQISKLNRWNRLFSIWIFP